MSKTKIKTIWITPDADKLIAYMARVSNPRATPDDPSEKLIKYLLDHKHFSPFEMASACVEIVTTRDIARQILRHRSFHFQEFSQRYSVVDEEPMFSDARLQDTSNRQNSIVIEDAELQSAWKAVQSELWSHASELYNSALEVGIAKELARKLLPEGLTPTRMYMSGTIRDWIHYLSVRTGPETQKEHRNVATSIQACLTEQCPTVFAAASAAGCITSID